MALPIFRECRAVSRGVVEHHSSPAAGLARTPRCNAQFMAGDEITGASTFPNLAVHASCEDRLSCPKWRSGSR
jgi:hypothetical protein